MRSGLVSLVVCLLVTLSSSLCFAGNHATRELTLEQKVQRSLDYQEIQNVMSKHEYYHALKLNKEEVDTIWCKKAPNPSFAQNQGYFVGYERLYATYRNGCEIMNNDATERMKKLYPELADKSTKDIYAVGSLVMHTTTTPIIEVAGDGKTAKGMWYSPGQITEIGPNGPDAAWIWEKYAVDFIKEDGEWKIWHMLVSTDFCVPVAGGKSWADETLNAPMGGKGAQKVDEKPPADMPGPNVAVETYKVYSKTQVPQNFPRMPEPYWTFSETFSYDPEGY
ncbi:MAG: hypothetical protein H6Q67_1597 [Firmicutes bacterium]|nr:hypothetical protein [Bacillota bacterium]